MRKYSKPLKLKEPVRLRYKKLANGNQSIYLDYYRDGTREYEFLKLYLIVEKLPTDKVKNEETLRLANAVKAKRIVEIQNNAHGFSNAGAKSNLNFIDYLNEQAEKYSAKDSTAYARSILNAINHLKAYKGANVKMKQIDKKYLLGYIVYLDSAIARGDKPLSDSAKALYFQVVVIALNRAVKEKIISSNPAREIDKEEKPKQGESTREYLTLEEVKQLVSTECNNPHVKQTFLFSCMTGLRMSDVRSLTWDKIRKSNDSQLQVQTIQQKTKAVIYVPLSANAMKFLPDRGDSKDTDKVFAMPHVSTVEKHLSIWAKNAKITKHVTYHVSRHTNATLLLNNDTDIFTVSKLLGHKSVKTTEIYAKIIDQKKREAVESIPDIDI